MAISGETNQDFTPASSGNYAVEVTENGCVDTSACENVTVVGINNLQEQLSIKVYPNPSSGNFTIEFSELGENHIIIYNNLGQVVYNKIRSEDKVQIRLKDLAAGIYHININHQYSRRIVLQ